MRGWYRLYEDYSHDHGIVPQPALHDAKCAAEPPPAAAQFDSTPRTMRLPHFMTGGTVLAKHHRHPARRGRRQLPFRARLSIRGSGAVRHDYQLFNVLGQRGPGAADAPPPGAGAVHMFRRAGIPADLVVDDVVRDALAAHRPPGGWGVILEALD